MIQSRITINNRPIEAIIDYLQGYAEVVQEEAQAAYAEVMPDALNELRTVPGAVVYPIAWQSEKQRRAFFATNGFNSGIPYQRTGGLAQAWEFVLDASGTQFTAVIRNKNKAAPFVYGSLAPTNPGAFQQIFHQNTGWETMYDTAQFWMNALRETFLDNMAARLGDLVGNMTTRQRAFTRTH